MEQVSGILSFLLGCQKGMTKPRSMQQCGLHL